MFLSLGVIVAIFFFFKYIDRKNKEQRAKTKEQRQKTKDKRENIKTIHLCTNANTHWLSVVEACSSLSKTRSLSVVEVGEEKTKEQRAKRRSKDA